MMIGEEVPYMREVQEAIRKLFETSFHSMTFPADMTAQEANKIAGMMNYDYHGATEAVARAREAMMKNIERYLADKSVMSWRKA